MCGRYTLSRPRQALPELFPLDELLPEEEPLIVEPRYNIAPTQQVLAVFRLADQPRPRAGLLRWGLVPFWDKDGKEKAKTLINARAETAAKLPAFRAPFRQRRCLVVADGFYEWRAAAGGKKQPFAFRLEGDRPFAFAGLWDRWQTPDGPPLLSCAILTTEASEVVRPVHERMPVILPREHFGRWLDPAWQTPEEVRALLGPYAGGDLIRYPVSTAVNNSRVDDPRCLEPLPDGPGGAA